MATRVRRIDLSEAGDDLEQTITDLCDNMQAADFRLSATFVFQTQLVLIFESSG